jgi:uncharacterized protein YkwD
VAAARPHVTLTTTPQARTSDTTAVFRWKTSLGTARTLCRLRWRALPGGSKHARPKIARAFRRCHSPATWKHLVAGRYMFTLVARGHRGKARWRNYSWKVLPSSAVSSPPPSSTNCAKSPYKYLWPVQPEVSSVEQQFVKLVNQARQSLGLKSLSLNSKLSLAADSQSYWQDVTYGRSGLSHTGCRNSAPWDRLTDAGYSAAEEGEVTLVRYPPASAQTAFDMFKGSPPHWALLTSPVFTQIGVGESAYHWTADLGG